MQQTFYIDIDEEVSSVIDRLNKSMSGENYFVVPKHAFFLQSVVNLKLLQHEASKAGKKISIITQDEIGASMAQRLGIDTHPTLEGLKINPDEYFENGGEENVEYEKDVINQSGINPQKEQSKQNRLSEVGSEDFYITPDNDQKLRNISENNNHLTRDVSIKSVPVLKNVAQRNDLVNSSPNKISQTKVYRTIDTRNIAQRNLAANSRSRILQREPQKEPQREFQRESKREQLDLYKEKTLEKMFSKPPISSVAKNSNKNKERKTGKIFLSFIAVCILVLLGVAGYLFVPSANIIIIPNVLKIKTDVNVHASSSTDSDKKEIAVRIIEKEESLSLPFDVSGEGQKSGKKASGSVVIYNEYSTAPQPLVATTRLETEDGKIFRLVKGVTVPGTTKVGNEIKPGAIEASVIADKAGSEFNIDSSKFTIPGFAGGEKFEKFYAKSSVAMAGGTSTEEGGNIESLKTKIIQSDINSAKEKTEAALKEKIAQSIAGELREGEVALPQAEKITITKTSADVKVGNAAKPFSYSATASAKAIIFSENEIKNIIKQKLEKQQTEEFKGELLKIEYSTIEPDFENSALNLELFGETMVTPIIDLQQIKKELLGKSTDQFGDILKKYSSIKNVKVEFQPAFISSVPEYSQRVTIEEAISE